MWQTPTTSQHSELEDKRYYGVLRTIKQWVFYQHMGRFSTTVGVRGAKTSKIYTNKNKINITVVSM